ncbi:Probable inorganic phosphate transporter 1 [Seminavis robusta]|uniref:Probable inorganic phosphate transporter 1 n=1 Tax=Seminavis robusta TaxID=568900 RepID=A0A9N8D9Q1_9STRA|nr:Probable inorganic phosphate transporter 1 [Seminavis robusta]|eukprot:Sro55_g032160.1 Probable inorganic phosphate transporter 1 (650) ;mRNA; f:16687-19133
MEPCPTTLETLTDVERHATTVPQEAKEVYETTSRSNNSLVKSVLLAEGIHHDIANHDLKELPDRFDRSSYKATVTWFGTLLLAGIGMFVEAYIIITTGQIKTIWRDQYPECWMADKAQHCPELIECCGLFKDNPLDVNGTCSIDKVNIDYCTAEGQFQHEVQCNESVLGAISYAEFAGIMLGMLTFAFVADIIGRAKAGVVVSYVMCIGLTMMTFYDDTNHIQIFLLWAMFFGLFGLGVGGEYPLAASNAASEHSEELEDALLDDEDRHHRRVLHDHARTARRGETISIVFSMQGIGAVAGSVFLIILLYFADQTYIDCFQPGVNSMGTDPRALNAVWRSFYFIGGIFVVMVLLYRTLVLEEGVGHERMQSRKQRRLDEMQDKRQKVGTLKILWFYAPRLLGTGGAWIVYDVAFYGLKLFSGPIFDQISPNGDLIVVNGWLLVNNLVALVGYYAAAAVIDIPWIGRKRLQMFSFTLCAILFGITAHLFESASGETLLALFIMSSFFGQFGGNAIHIMAAETFPTELRGTCHGLSAFMGKCGALAGTLAFSHVPTVQIFWIYSTVSIAGIFFTLLFCVDLTHISLAEHDAQLELFLEGRLGAYRGKLNDEKHLSLFERWLGLHGTYEPGWAKELVDDEMLRRQESAIATA